MAAPRIQLSLERLLQIVVAGMIVLATMLFSAGHRSTLLALLVPVVAVASICLNDVSGRFRISKQGANFLSLAAVIVWLVETLVLEGDLQLVAVTYVLLALQVILLFQYKSPRVYWQLLVLSAAQVAVAAALTPGLWFGVLLLGYTLLGSLALALLLMQRELARFQRPALAAAAALGSPPAAASALQGGGVGRPALHFVGTASALAEMAWQHTVARQAAAIGVWTLLTTFIVFVLFPRADRELDISFEDMSRSVGFSKEVTLGDEVGSAQQNPDVVMRMQLFEEPSGLPIQLIGEPLLRGSVATNYARGKWRQSRSSGNRPFETILAKRYVRQRITIEPQEDVTLFAVAPMFAMDDDEERIDVRGDELVRRRSLRGQRIEFEVATTGIHERKQDAIVPQLNRFRRVDAQLLQMPGKNAEGVDPLAGLRETAERVRVAAQLEPTDHLRIARALAAYLRDTGGFQYTLLGQKRDTGVDPLEDFVVTHRRGHCEYFAGALALMLRSQGIPARVAIGFRAAEWNSAGEYYQVRQLHAHTWVEAFLEPEHYANEKVTFDRDDAPGAIAILDPTPGGDAGSDERFSQGFFARAGMYFDYLQVLWGKYVTGLDAKTQQESIYAPLENMFGGLYHRLFNLDTWRNAWSSVLATLTRPFGWYRENWFSLSGALASTSGLLAALGLYRAGRWLARRHRRKQQTVSTARAGTAPTVDFYQRLERALARRGLARGATQTPYEFALAAGGELAESIQHMGLAPMPRRVVEAFYRVRFGRRPLDKGEAEAVEHALSALEDGLA